MDADGANNDIIFQSNGSTKATLDQAGLLTTAAVNVTGTVDNTISGTLVVKGGLSANQTSALTLFQQNSTHSTIKAFGANGSTTGVLNIYCAASDGSPDTLVTSVTANGLTFNGDTAAANAISDYEEGTCTIQYSDGSTAVGSANTSKYTKVGRQVTVTGYINVVNIDALTNSAAILLAGFPFAATGDATFSFFSRFLNTPDNTINIVGYLPNNNTAANLYAMVDNAAYQSITCGNVGNSNDLYFAVTYTAS